MWGGTDSVVTPHELKFPLGFRPAFYQFRRHHLSSLALGGGRWAFR